MGLKQKKAKAKKTVKMLHYVDADGSYLGCFSDGNKLIPSGAIEVSASPEDGRQKWNGSKWSQLDMAVLNVEKRVSEYPSIGDQLDAIWKELNRQRLGGANLVADADSMLGKILAVKKKYPKK